MINVSDIVAILPSFIDSTMMTVFRSCPRKFFHEHILGLRAPGVKIDLHAGACVATTLESIYTAVYRDKASLTDAMKVGFTVFTQTWGDEVAPSDSPKSYDRMWESVVDYFRVYPPLTDHIQPYIIDGKHLTTEFSFAIPLTGPEFPRHPVTGDPFLYAGRFDMLGSFGGKPVVKDEKTTKQAGPTWASQWDLRSQFMGYVWACQQSGIPLDTVVIRGIVIQKREIRQLEAIKSFPQYMIDRWYRQLSRDLHRIVECWNSSYFDYNFGDSCTAYGRCQFTSVCQGKVPEQWMVEYNIFRWNPLARSSDEIPFESPRPHVIRD